MDTEIEKFNRAVDERVKKILPVILRGNAFVEKKVTDTPTDNLQVVPRKYVNLNGTLANRPKSSVATMGQFYYATDTSIPMRYNAFSSVWTNGVGSTVAQG
jgi:hypothetical protein